MAIEMVLPLKAENGERGADLARTHDGLIVSLNRFASPDFVKKLTIIAPDEDVAIIKPLATDCLIPIEVVPESEILPISTIGSIPRRGWFVQQFVKLAFAQRCEEDFYVTLDSDIFLLRSLNEDIFQNGLAPAKYEPVSAHPGWWDASALALQVPVSAKTFNQDAAFGVTPAFLKTEIVRDLLSRLDSVAQKKDEGNWISYLCARTDMNNFCWTEYSLYWTHLINTADPTKIYYELDIYFYTHYIWQARQVLMNPAHPAKQPFAIIQSSQVEQEEFSVFLREYFGQSK